MSTPHHERELSANDYLNLHRSLGPSRKMYMLLAGLMTLAGFLSAAPLQGVAPAAATALLCLLALLVWAFTIRRRGLRSNKYDPLTPDDGNPSNRVTWRNEITGWLGFVFLFAFFRIIPTSTGWAVAGLITIITAAASIALARSSMALPTAYLSPATIVDRENYAPATGDDLWLRTYLHAREAVPFGYQIRSDVLNKELADLGWKKSEVHDALIALEARGDVKMLRELGSHGAEQWVTLTAQGRDRQQSGQQR